MAIFGDLNIGDRVQLETGTKGTVHYVAGDKATIKRDDREGGSGIYIPSLGKAGWEVYKRDDGCWGSNGNSGYLKMIKKSDNKLTKKTMGTESMSLIQKMRLAIMGEPEKTLTKAGVLGSDGNLTSEGKELFITYLFNSQKQAFTDDVVAKIVAESEKEKK